MRCSLPARTECRPPVEASNPSHLFLVSRRRVTMIFEVEIGVKRVLKLIRMPRSQQTLCDVNRALGTAREARIMIFRPSESPHSMLLTGLGLPLFPTSFNLPCLPHLGWTLLMEASHPKRPSWSKRSHWSWRIKMTPRIGGHEVNFRSLGPSTHTSHGRDHNGISIVDSRWA